MGKRGDLPIMVGRNLRKGLLALRNKANGFDLFIVWLKKDYEQGADYDLSDIEKVDAVLHFCDRESTDYSTRNAINATKKAISILNIRVEKITRNSVNAEKGNPFIFR